MTLSRRLEKCKFQKFPGAQPLDPDLQLYGRSTLAHFEHTKSPAFPFPKLATMKCQQTKVKFRVQLECVHTTIITSHQCHLKICNIGELPNRVLVRTGWVITIVPHGTSSDRISGLCESVRTFRSPGTTPQPYLLGE